MWDTDGCFIYAWRNRDSSDWLGDPKRRHIQSAFKPAISIIWWTLFSPLFCSIHIHVLTLNASIILVPSKISFARDTYISHPQHHILSSSTAVAHSVPCDLFNSTLHQIIDPRRVSSNNNGISPFFYFHCYVPHFISIKNAQLTRLARSSWKREKNVHFNIDLCEWPKYLISINIEMNRPERVRRVCTKTSKWSVESKRASWW